MGIAQECIGDTCGDGTLSDGTCYYNLCAPDPNSGPGATCVDVTFVLCPSNPEHLTYSKFFVGAGTLGDGTANHYRLLRQGNMNKWQVTLQLDPVANAGGNYIFIKDPAHNHDWEEKEHLNAEHHPDIEIYGSFCCADSDHHNDRMLPEVITGNMVLEHCYETCDGQQCDTWPSIELDACQVCGGTPEDYAYLEPLTLECLASANAASSSGSSGTTIALSVVLALVVVALVAAAALIFYMRTTRGVVIMGLGNSGGKSQS